MIQWPKYYIASEPPRPLPPTAENPPAFVVDLFLAPMEAPSEKKSKPDSIEAPAPRNVEWAVTVDSTRHLRVEDARNRSAFPPEIQSQLNTHELLMPTRVLRARPLFLFDLEYVDHGANAPGLNDPVHLDGRLYGPFPSESPCFAPGRLTVTRADILEGLIRESSFAFQFAETRGLAASAHRCYHLLLPGGGLPEIRKGESAILAFPQLGIALSGGVAGNKALTASLVYDLLSELQTDFRRENVSGAFPELKLPVPNRRRHETALKSQGYEIKGDVAYSPIAKASRTWIGRLFQGFLREKETLPPEGTLSDFLRVAHVGLQAMPNWPDSRAKALRKLTTFQTCAWTAERPWLLRPVDKEEQAPLAIEDGKLVSLPKPKARFIPFVVDECLSPQTNATLDLHVEYQGGPAICKLLYQSIASSGFIGSHARAKQTWGGDSNPTDTVWGTEVNLDKTEQTRVARFSASGAMFQQGLWNRADFAILVESKYRFNICRAVLTVRGTQSDDSGLQCAIQNATVLKAVPGAIGNLEGIGRWHNWSSIRFAPVPRRAGLAIPFSGWMADSSRKSAEGNVSLILKGKGGEFVFAAEKRRVRPDVVNAHKEDGYKYAGFEGKIRTEEIPAGDYTAVVRLIRPDNASYQDLESYRSVRLYDEQPHGSAAPPAIEPASLMWPQGTGQNAGFDPCFECGVTHWSGHITYRFRVQRNTVYLIAIGLLEPEYEKPGERLYEILADGVASAQTDVAAETGGKGRPRVIIIPAYDWDGDGNIEVKVARRRESTGGNPHAFVHGLWLFDIAVALNEEQVARGTWTQEALAYCACGASLQRATDLMRTVLPEAKLLFVDNSGPWAKELGTEAKVSVFSEEVKTAKDRLSEVKRELRAEHCMRDDSY